MKINSRILGWEDKCCGCRTVIKSKEKVFILGDIAGVWGTLHLCQNCINLIKNIKSI